MHTATSDSRDAHERPLLATPPGLVPLQDLNSSVHDVIKRQTKKSQSAGFYTYVAAQHAEELAQHAAGGFAADVSALRNVVHDAAAAAAGGFRDVGAHTTSTPLPTCWPLVRHVFHFLAQQVRLPHPAAACAIVLWNSQLKPSARALKITLVAQAAATVASKLAARPASQHAGGCRLAF